ncbi:type VI secretion system secreted protein VgrG, partial [Chitinivorax tropicus]
RSLQPGAVSLQSYDFKAAGSAHSQLPTHHQYSAGSQTLVAALEDYDSPGNLYGADQADLDRYAKQRMEALEARAKQFTGCSSVPELQVGQWFELTEHAIHDQDEPANRQFAVLRVRHQGRNNFEDVFRQGLHTLFPVLADTEQPIYHNQLTAQRRQVPYRPWFDPHHHAGPTAPGPQIAIVVGPPGEEIHTDRWGRIKIQFPWQRPQDHRPADTGSGASHSDNSSCWLQVEQAISGAGWGARYLPRVGQAVVVDFLDGQIDRPIVRSVVHNAQHPAVEFSAQGSLPGNKTLSGFKSKEYRGGSYSELLFDDSTGQVRARLATTVGQSALNLGWLAHPRQDGRAQPRGNGAELRTDDSLALRSGKGMLISAFEQLRAEGPQLSRDETLRVMEECLKLFRQLGEYACKHQAQATQSEPHQQMQSYLKQWEEGNNTAPDRSGGGEPMVAMTAPSGLIFNTPQTVATHAGQNIDTVAQQHWQLAAGERIVANAGRGVSLFAQSEDMKLIAHQGRWLGQSQQADAHLEAAKNVKISASGGKVQVMASDEIMLVTGDGTFIRLGGGKITMGCSGTATIHAANHHWVGPATDSADLPQFDKGDVGRTPQLLHPLTQAGIPGVRYEITRNDGSVIHGVTDEQGRVAPIAHNAFENLRVRFMDSDD